MFSYIRDMFISTATADETEPTDYKSESSKFYYDILHDTTTTGEMIESLCHECLVDIINSRDCGEAEIENALQTVLIYLLADQRITDRTRIFEKINSLF